MFGVCDIPGCGKRAGRGEQASGLCQYHRSKDYNKAYHSKRYDNDGEYRKNRRTNAIFWGKQLKEELFKAYGDKCACCNEAEPKFLQLDHINNDGAAHRNSLGGHGMGPVVYQDLRRKGFPPGYQILCANCNTGKQLNNGVCPHKGTK